MSVYFENETGIEFDFNNPEEIAETAVYTVFDDKEIPEELDVNILVISPEDIREINRENRNIDSATDVLSFPYYDYDEPGVFEGEIYEDEENILGDIILCGEKIISQAEEYGHSQKREFAFLIVHSCLHLLGYDHMEADDAQIMQSEERRLMDLIDIHR
ncbi:MAG: rRNA maturation RNase YbeY [Lachnospiraceae bacterium]|nr:rRNA maturation RNase YbeY [Lachnospiraceae bacterium]